MLGKTDWEGKKEILMFMPEEIAIDEDDFKVFLSRTSLSINKIKIKIILLLF